ncbi:hypothetical protein [Methanonatronarchaeum thermophilum]|nr:hypothetical protein [Methanonatronarchaeum thermophilum]
MRENKEVILRALNYNDLTFLELEKKTNLDDEKLDKELVDLSEEGHIEKLTEEKDKELNQFAITEKGKRAYKKYMRDHFDRAEE